NGIVLDQQYHPNGYMAQLRDVTAAASPKVLWAKGTSLDELGNTKYQLAGNGVVTQTTYNANSGRISGIKSSSLRNNGDLSSLYGEVQKLIYSYDSVGNMVKRSSVRTDINNVTGESLSETFTYDALNRLKHSSTLFGTPRELDFGYDLLGNLNSRTDLGTLTYDRSRNAGPHAITQVGTTLYGYDAYGNMITRGTTSAQYNVYNKPTTIGSGTFAYGPNHELVKSVNNGITSYFFGDNYREETQSGQISEKITLPGIAVLARSGGVLTTTYLHSDALGSVEAMTDKLGQNTTRLSFDAWGKRQKSDWTTGSPGSSFATSTGFTGHEMLDPSGLIHMGGRVYDANIGRFMSADILVQNPYDSQSFNRYSYVGNRPLSLVDPTGYSGVTREVTTDNWSGNVIGDTGWVLSDTLGCFSDNPGMSGPSPWDIYTAAAVEIANTWQPAVDFAQGTAEGLIEDTTDDLWDAAKLTIFGEKPNIFGPAKTEAEENGRNYGAMLLPLMMRSPSGAAKVGGNVLKTGAESVNAQSALRAKLSGLEKAQQNAASTRQLSDGRVRYYSKEVPARTEGPTRGASFVTEHNPKSGTVRQWMESYDQAGAVNRVHPKSINGQTVESQHFPPTARELGL
ncbi:MAG TPA: RHS repeat-associated core domain-containing protein, partial [Cellvibrionaceae bacterium]|nr:RHS repeat-associated core domain-containing protein [Cellvibrionaceae bacterium]